MKRIIIIFIGILLFLNAVALAEQDYSQYSLEQLLTMRSVINKEIANREVGGEIIHEDNNIKITWLVLKDDLGNYVKADLLIENKTQKSIYYQITKLAFNNIQTTMVNSFSSYEIAAEMSYLTASNNLFMVDLNSLASVGIDRIKDIKDVFLEISFYDSQDFGAKTKSVVKSTISVK